MARKYARKAADRVAKLGLANVRVLPGDALLFLAKYVPPTSLRAAHVYFPRPLVEGPTQEAPVFGEPLILDLERTLEPRAYLFVATDVEEYFRVIKALMATHPRFREQTRTVAEHARARQRLSHQFRAEIPDRRSADLPGSLPDRLKVTARESKVWDSIRGPSELRSSLWRRIDQGFVTGLRGSH